MHGLIAQTIKEARAISSTNFWSFKCYLVAPIQYDWIQMCQTVFLLSAPNHEWNRPQTTYRVYNIIILVFTYWSYSIFFCFVVVLVCKYRDSVTRKYVKQRDWHSKPWFIFNRFIGTTDDARFIVYFKQNSKLICYRVAKRRICEWHTHKKIR